MLTTLGMLFGASIGTGVAGLCVGFRTKIKDVPWWFFGALFIGAALGAVLPNAMI